MTLAARPLQVVAASGGIVTDVMADFFEEKAKKDYKGQLSTLAVQLREMREIFKDCMQYVSEKRDASFQDVALRQLCELYSYPLIGYLLLDQAEVEPRKVFIANRYILSAASSARKNAESIKNGAFSDMLHADEILI
jgi:hypothetical protein